MSKASSISNAPDWFASREFFYCLIVLTNGTGNE